METDKSVRYARLAAKLLATARTRPDLPSATKGRRATTVAAMEAKLRMRARRRRTGRLVVGWLGVATLAALALALLSPWP